MLSSAIQRHACKIICDFYIFTSCIALVTSENITTNVQILIVSIIKAETFQIFCQTAREVILWKQDMQASATLNIILNSLTRKSFINTDNVQLISMKLCEYV